MNKATNRTYQNLQSPTPDELSRMALVGFREINAEFDDIDLDAKLTIEILTLFITGADEKTLCAFVDQGHLCLQDNVVKITRMGRKMMHEVVPKRSAEIAARVAPLIARWKKAAKDKKEDDETSKRVDEMTMRIGKEIALLEDTNGEALTSAQILLIFARYYRKTLIHVVRSHFTKLGRIVKTGMGNAARYTINRAMLNLTVKNARTSSQRRLNAISELTPDEAKRLLEASNSTTQPLPRPKPLLAPAAMLMGNHDVLMTELALTRKRLTARKAETSRHRQQLIATRDEIERTLRDAEQAIDASSIEHEAIKRDLQTIDAAIAALQ